MSNKQGQEKGKDLPALKARAVCLFPAFTRCTESSHCIGNIPICSAMQFTPQPLASDVIPVICLLRSLLNLTPSPQPPQSSLHMGMSSLSNTNALGSSPFLSNKFQCKAPRLPRHTKISNISYLSYKWVEHTKTHPEVFSLTRQYTLNMQAALFYSHFVLNQPKLLTDTNLAFLTISLVFPLCFQATSYH